MRSSMHKLACQNFLDPGPVKTLIDIMSDNVDDIDLLRGAVPQVKDWVRVWQTLRHASFNTAEFWHVQPLYYLLFVKNIPMWLFTDIEH